MCTWRRYSNALGGTCENSTRVVLEVHVKNAPRCTWRLYSGTLGDGTEVDLEVDLEMVSFRIGYNNTAFGPMHDS